MAQQPYYAPPKSGGAGKVVAIVLGCVVVIALVVTIAVVASNSGSHHDSAAASTTTPTTTDSSPPTTESTEPTTPAFDPNTLDDAATDQTPFTADALLPESFTDSKNVLYNRVGTGGQGCVQPSDSANVKQALNQNNCTTNMSGTYVDKDNNILVSVSVLVFPRSTSAHAAYDALDGPTQDWVIWCPTTGIGSSVCSGDTSRAVKTQWSSVRHRYFVEATAIYINLTRDTSVQQWVDAAAHQASLSTGPQNH